jgi:hypothetical protein
VISRYIWEIKKTSERSKAKRNPPKVRESEANLNWNVKLTVRVKACLPEEPEPEPGG